MEDPNDSRLEGLVERLDRLERRHRAQRRWLLGAALTAPLLVLASSSVGHMILAEALLSYLTVGVAPPELG